MTGHQQKVLKFLLSAKAAEMSKKEVNEHLKKMKAEDWQIHTKKRKPDGTCRSGCPLHSNK